MIKLTISEKKEKELLSCVTSFFKNSNTYNYKDVAKVIYKDLGISFKKLILMKPKELMELKNYIDSNNIATTFDFEDLYKRFRNSVSGKKFIRVLDVNVCPYCNRNYIFNFNKKKSTEATAQLDHFFDKSSFPHLSLCVYNLVPSCSTCNLRKSSKQEDILYPYAEGFNDFVKFRYKFNDNKVDFFHKDKIELDFDIKYNETKVESHMKVFNIKNLYENHKDIVLELIQKREIYSDSYIDELMQNFEGKVFGSRYELMRLITCGYVKDKDINKRPLSKLIKDISEELELI